MSMHYGLIHLVVLADLLVYKRRLIELPDPTKLRAYGLPENPDSVANFTFINENNAPFEINTEGAHLKYIRISLVFSLEFLMNSFLGLFIHQDIQQIIFAIGSKKKKLYSQVI